MSMPTQNFHVNHDLPTPKYTTQRLGWKYPTQMAIRADSGTGGWNRWSDTGPDDLGNNEQVVFGGDGVRENLAYTSNTLMVSAFNGAKILNPTDVIDSISISFRALMDSDGARTYSMKVSKVGIGNSLPYTYPTTDIQTTIFPIFSSGTFANSDTRYIWDIPPSNFGRGIITPNMVNDSDFFIVFQITKTAGTTTSPCRARFYQVALDVEYHTPDPLPPGAGTDAANLIKFSTC